jgi:ubiquinone/menaquinone biosynthesis C-methylase UbiE
MVNPEETLNIAIQQHLSNNFAGAMELYQTILNKHPQHHHAWHLLGVLLIQNGLFDEGVMRIQKALELQPDCSQALSNLRMVNNSITQKTELELANIPQTQAPHHFDTGTVNRWRHERMMSFTECFKQGNHSWLTIGDAYGHDAMMLMRAGINQVTASNLDASNLQISVSEGMIQDCLEINAESIPLPDASFDYVLCKEALHHMPRPMLAIYEMYRVCRHGVIFIEPQDPTIDWPMKKPDLFYRESIPADNIGEKISFKRMDTDETFSSQYIDWWEDGVNNYVYTMSKRELRKLVLGMGAMAYGTKNFNDFYQADWGSQPATENSEGFIKTKEQIELHDLACEKIGKPHAYLTGMLFKRAPDINMTNQLRHLGFEITTTPTRYVPISWPKGAV